MNLDLAFDLKVKFKIKGQDPLILILTLLPRWTKIL